MKSITFVQVEQGKLIYNVQGYGAFTKVSKDPCNSCLTAQRGSELVTLPIVRCIDETLEKYLDDCGEVF